MTPKSTETFQGSNGSTVGHRENGNGERRRAELADFLRRRRASIQPEDVGLPSGGRRRTPGLRREGGASLAGGGTTRDTWVRPGPAVAPPPPRFLGVAQGLGAAVARARA